MKNVASLLSGLSGEITADSTPDYDNWGPDSYWKCEEWRTWLIANIDKYGLEAARQKFKQAWDKMDAWEHAVNLCPYNSDFVNFLLSKGIDIRSYLSAILVPILGAGANIAEGTEDASVGVNKTVNTLKALLPIAVIGIVAAGGYYAYKTYLK